MTQKTLKVLNAPEPGSLTLELALTELVPSNPVLDAAAIAAPYGSGVVVRVAAKESGAKATVAFEARLVDTDTGTVLFMAADREQGKVAPVNLSPHLYGSDLIIEEWAISCPVANNIGRDRHRPRAPSRSSHVSGGKATR